jgi:heat-inducible transcriptional repressor
MAQLQEREETILTSLISAHMFTGEPIGSRTISKSGLGLSPATVRNSMADLEEKGYLTHPHTSAGRVPTDKGYRYYVDQVMGQEDLAETDREQIRQCMAAQLREGNIQGLIEQVSKVVAEVSQNLGVALKPRFEQGTFERLELVHLSESKVLLVLTIKSGLVKTIVMEIDSAIDVAEIDETRRVINERLSGLTVAEIRDSVLERLKSVTRGSPKLLRIICESADTLFNFSSGDDLHFGGTGNFFLKPEFSNHQTELAALMGMLEAREPMVTILDERMDQEGVKITIGNENTSPELQGYSLLTSRYQVGNVSGLVGVIGPTRLPYARIIPLIQYMAELTEELIEHK